MSDKSAIEWTEATWNPVRGCTKVSPGCKNCYAETFAERWRGVPGHAYEQGFVLRLVPEALDLPLRWKKPRRVFVNSMSDLFHEDVPDSFIMDVLMVAARARQHTFQILTKRAERMRRFFETHREWWGEAPPHIWLGVSIENQAAADERIPHLLATPAAVRFLSCEPLLEPVDLGRWLEGAIGHSVDCIVCHQRKAPWGRSAPLEMMGGLCNHDCEGYGQEPRPGDLWPGEARRDFGYGQPAPDWVIVGGESGPRARPCDVAWIRSIVQQCRATRVPAFVKQLGAHVEDRNDAGFEGEETHAWPADTETEDDPSDTGYQGAPVRVRLIDRKGGDVREWPSDLRVREFPER